MIRNLDTVFTRLSEATLKLKARKCQLFKRKVHFLGHVVSAEGITTDPKKIEAVRDWPTPSCVKDVPSFVGLCSYYRRFIPNFADIAKPLHRLVQKGVKFEWTTDCDSRRVHMVFGCETKTT